MTDRENDFQNRSGQSRAQDSEGRQVQQELENQLRAFGDTVSCLLYTSPSPRDA